MIKTYYKDCTYYEDGKCGMCDDECTYDEDLEECTMLYVIY